MQDVFNDLYNTIVQRRDNPQEGSYTCYLFEQGIDKVLKKCGEECTETIIAAKNNNKNEIIYEIGDLIFHLSVLMAQTGVTPGDITAELERRSQKSGNLKKMHKVDKNT
ncbi:MAG TPA: phosphoribosyl-ATP diphosphatase [Clostridia bacterium]|nr:phosphoribosyl-ATP diphosphatase [Clostridia bacterium]